MGTARLEQQPHGGALQRGRKPGQKPKPRLPALPDVAKPTHVRRAWLKLVKLIDCPDPAIAYRAAAGVLAYTVGRPLPMNAHQMNDNPQKGMVTNMLFDAAERIRAAKEEERALVLERIERLKVDPDYLPDSDLTENGEDDE